MVIKNLLRTLSLFFILLYLGACSYVLKMVERGGGNIGTGEASEMSEDVKITLNGKTYKGTYTYDDGSGVAFTNLFGSATSTSSAFGTGGYASGTGSSVGSAFGTTAYANNSGKGQILVINDEVGAIKCTFSFTNSNMGIGGNGIGECIDPENKIYDLMITTAD